MTIKILESAVEDLERGRRYTRNHSVTIVSYLIEDDVVIIYRVLDLRQNPESIRDYLKPDGQPEQG